MNNRRKVALVLCVVLAMAIVGIGARGILQLLSSVGEDTNFAVESLRWTMFGAIGSWAGSVFGAIALIISLLALWLPQRVKIKVSMSTGYLLSQMPGADKFDRAVGLMRPLYTVFAMFCLNVWADNTKGFCKDMSWTDLENQIYDLVREEQDAPKNKNYPIHYEARDF